MAICPTCGKTFDERSFHVLASGQAFDTAECALLALEAANPEIGLAGLPAPAGLGPFARPGRSAMMRSMRARLPFGLLVAALAASAILSAYLWLRALGAGPTPPVRPLSLMPAERRSVETLPGIVYHAPATARRTEARKHPAQARAAARRRPSPPRVVETSAATPPTAQLVSAPVPRSTPAPPPAPSPPPSPSPKPKPSPAPPSPAPPAPTPPAPTPSPSPPQPAPSPPPVPTPPSPEPAAAAVPPSPAPAPQNSPPESQPASTPPSSESSKPGWGCGDKNHSHSGPPGNGGGNGSPC